MRSINCLKNALSPSLKYIRGFEFRAQHSLVSRSLSDSQGAPKEIHGSDAFDIAVVGSGMTGSAVVSGIVTNPLLRHLKVVVVDRNPLQVLTSDMASTPDARVVSLNPSTVQFLKSLGVWEGTKSHPYKSMKVWDFYGSGFVDFHASEVGRSELGFIVENRDLVSQLQECFQGCSSVEAIAPASIASVEWPKPFSAQQQQAGQESRTHVHLSSGRSISARLVVAADGSRSLLRQLAGIRTSGHSYDQSAVVATVQLERATCTAYQKFLEEGPIAILPRGSSLATVVWSTTNQKAAELAEADPAHFVRCVNSALSFRTLPGGRPEWLAALAQPWLPSLPLILRQIGPCFTFPLRLSHSHRYVAPGLVLVGDSGHTIHPMAGQGVNLGFSDAACLLSWLSKGVQNGEDLSQGAFLEEYESERQRENLSTIAAQEWLKMVFGVKLAPFCLARNVGLDAVRLSPPVKTMIARAAMGL